MNVAEEVVAKVNKPSEEDESAAATDDDQPASEEEEIMEKLKGDRIGETMYSERFVLSTILKLSQPTRKHLAEDEDFEKDLCNLWDMTIEKDVVQFLLQHDVIELFLGLSADTDDNRLLEILFGIIGNMCCVEDTHKLFYANQTLLLAACSFLDSIDPLVLVQLMRLFTTLFDRSDDDQFCWFKVMKDVQGLTDKLSFILSFTTNQQLLEHTVEAVHAMVVRFSEAEVDYAQLNEFYRIFAAPSLVQALFESFDQLFPEHGTGHGQFEEEVLTTAQLKLIQKFLEVHENFIINKNDLYQESIEKMAHCVYRVLVPLCNESSLFPLTKAHARIFVCINSIYSAIIYHFHGESFNAMIRIYVLLSKQATAECEEEEADEEENFDVKTTIGQLLEALYFMIEPIDGKVIVNALRLGSFSESTMAALAKGLKETMDGDPLLGKTCEKLMNSAAIAREENDRVQRKDG